MGGGGYFPFITENRPQKHKNHTILHTSQANGGGLEPPPPPPGYATGGDPFFGDYLISTRKTVRITVKTFFFGDHIIIRTKLRRQSIIFELAPGPRSALGAPESKTIASNST